jgi:hypothetical protein
VGGVIPSHHSIGEIIMATNPFWKEENAALIISYSMRKESQVEFYIRAGKVVIEKVTGDFMGDPLTIEEVQAVVTDKIQPQLWWCRAAANKIKLNIPFMDWYFYKTFPEDIAGLGYSK